MANHHLITRDHQFITAQDDRNLCFMTQRPSKHLNQQIASINKLNEEKQLLEDMKNALNSSSNMNDFENKLKQLRTASLSRSVAKQRFNNRFADTMAKNPMNHLQFPPKSIMTPSNEHIYESIENSHFLNNSNKLSSDQDFYFNQKLNAYAQQNEANLIQTNDDDWSCSSYSTMNGVYDEKPLLLSNRALHSRQANEQLDYEDKLQAMHLRENLRQSGHSFNVDQLSDDQLPDLLLKFKNDFKNEFNS